MIDALVTYLLEAWAVLGHLAAIAFALLSVAAMIGCFFARPGPGCDAAESAPAHRPSPIAPRPSP